MLKDLVISDRDAGVIRLAMETLRSLEMQSLRSLLDRRLQAEQAAGNQSLITPLAEEQERWLSLQAVPCCLHFCERCRLSSR